MPKVRIVVWLAAAVGVILGAALAYWWPTTPLLAYWLLVATALGIAVSTTSSLHGIRQRAAWLMTIYALLIAVSLATTQLAARRAISSTHLTYRGVHLAGVDSFTIGAGNANADIRLQTVSTVQVPWTIRVVRAGGRWIVQPVSGIEQLRVGPVTSGGRMREFTVAQSMILATPGDWVVVADAGGAAVDTLRLAKSRIESSSRNVFQLRPVNDAIEQRYRRGLRGGVTLAALDGMRTNPAVYERFVRVQELASNDVVNGASYSLAQRLLGRARGILVSASPPYSLRGASLHQDTLAVTDSSLVEVRNGDAVWRFQLRAGWRREPSANPGIALLFERTPSPLETPLPAGLSCQPGSACGAISLRRLPPPVAHIALDYAGFDPARFGLLGSVHESRGGYQVVLPRETYQVERGRGRPVAIPVTDLSTFTSAAAREAPPKPNRWVLLGASGYGDHTRRILAIAIGLALLFLAIYRGIAGSGGAPVPSSARHERWLMLGLTSILSLILARVIVGARVAFFEPFLMRGIETAIGLCVAIAVVAVGLLSWPAWLPPFLAAARATLGGQRSLRRLLAGVRDAIPRLVVKLSSPESRSAVMFGILSLIVLAVVVPAPRAVLYGVLAGVVVLLAWVCVAWVVAFCGVYFETFERGAWSVVEQLPPSNLIAPVPGTPPHGSAEQGGSFRRLTGWFGRLCRRAPELPLMLAVLATEFAHLAPRVLGVLAAMTLVIALIAVRRRRVKGVSQMQPDFLAATVGIAVFMLGIASLRGLTEHGAVGAFVLVVFVALAAVRIGRGIGSRLESSRHRLATAQSGKTPPLLVEALLLVAPVWLLLPLAGIDMGLVLVMVLPLGFATLLAVGLRAARWHLVPLVAVMLLLVFVGTKVVFPSVEGIRTADSHAAQAESFERMSTLFGMRIPGLATPMDRAAARSVATRDSRLAEGLLIAAKPGPARDLLIPSIEQVWGARAYSSAGWFGEGLGQAVVGGRGVAEPVSYAENTFSVFVLGEHGAVGGVLVLGLYALLTLAAYFCAVGHSADTPSYRASRALFLVAALIIAVPALYVAMSNLAIVPITGQNMPFLGLNAWSDVAICAGVVGILITGAMRGLEEVGGRWTPDV